MIITEWRSLKTKARTEQEETSYKSNCSCSASFSPTFPCCCCVQESLQRQTTGCHLYIYSIYVPALKKNKQKEQKKRREHRDTSTWGTPDPVNAPFSPLRFSPAKKPQRCLLLPLHNVLLFTHKSSLCKFQLCVRTEEKKHPGHLNSLLIIVCETQIESSNLHLDCFSRSKLINTATPPTHLYRIPIRTTHIHIFIYT